MVISLTRSWTWVLPKTVIALDTLPTRVVVGYDASAENYAPCLKVAIQFFVEYRHSVKDRSNPNRPALGARVRFLVHSNPLRAIGCSDCGAPHPEAYTTNSAFANAIYPPCICGDADAPQAAPRSRVCRHVRPRGPIGDPSPDVWQRGRSVWPRLPARLPSLARLRHLDTMGQ